MNRVINLIAHFENNRSMGYFLRSTAGPPVRIGETGDAARESVQTHSSESSRRRAT